MAKGLKELLAEARARVTEVTVAESRTLLEKHPAALVLDVREEVELQSGRVAGALHVPRGLLEPKAAADSPMRDEALADPERLILVYCASGVRSIFAADVLQVLGFSEVRSIAGGFTAWIAAGHAIEK